MSLLDDVLEEDKKSFKDTKNEIAPEKEVELEKEELRDVVREFAECRYSKNLPEVSEVRNALQQVNEFKEFCRLLEVDSDQRPLNELYPSFKDPGMELLKIAEKNGINLECFEKSYESFRDVLQNERAIAREGLSKEEREIEIRKEMLMDQYREIQEREHDVSRVVVNIAEHCGVELAGYEFRIKSWDSAYEKVAVRNESPDISSMKDIIRYTFLIPEDKFGDKVNDILDNFKDEGMQIEKLKNNWLDSTSYNGVNTQIKYQDINIEIQFHTQDSLDTKELMHPLYEQSRLGITIDKDEGFDICTRMKEIANAQRRPEGIEKIKPVNWVPKSK